MQSEDLTPLEAFKSDILIGLDGWVGMVRNVKSKLTLRFSDGSKVVVDDEVVAWRVWPWGGRRCSWWCRRLGRSYPEAKSEKRSAPRKGEFC